MSQAAVFGEVLFDCFPDSREVLGGAPFNVAWHLNGFGLKPLMLSAIGEDRKGELIIEAMEQWGMDTSGIQTTAFPTGQVSVSFDDGEPRYDILQNCAYDNIDQDVLNTVLSGRQSDLLYHGSLAARGQSNTQILKQLRENYPAFVDVNLRPPWWEFTTVRDMVASARWLKLNVHEFATLYLGEAETGKIQNDYDLLQDMARDIVSNSANMSLMILTLGEQGAICVSAEGCESSPPVPLTELVDTVGAGDAFSSVMILGTLKNWSVHDSLHRALAFASAICQIRGATSSDKQLYESFASQWGM